MATMQGITGKLSGKMGSAVFRVRDGQQVVTQYNPIVRNPNTEGQQRQRAKFKLMSQLSAIMAPAFGTLGVINRPARGKETQRNAFTRLNMELVEVSVDGEEVHAKIPMDQLQLTSSFRYLPQIILQAATGGIEISFNEDLPAAVATLRIATIGYVGDVAAIVDIRDVPARTFAEDNYKLDVPVGNYTVLAYGIIPSESAKATIDLDNIHTPDDENFVSAIQLNAMVSDGSLVETMTMGSNVTVIS